MASGSRGSCGQLADEGSRSVLPSFARQCQLHPRESSSELFLSYLFTFMFSLVDVQSVSGGIVNILGGGSMDYSE